MTQTNAGSVVELVNSEAIDLLIIAYPSDDKNVTPFFRFKSVIGLGTAVGSFPRWVKDSAEDLATEATAMTAQELETTDVQITAARVGIAREPTETVLEDTVLGRARFMEEIASDAATLLGMAETEDGAAQFPSATGSVTDSGNPIEIVDLVNGIGKQRQQKARGAQVIHLHDLNLQQLQAAQVAVTATPWGAFFTPNADSTSFGGWFMNAPIFSSSLNPTANTAADRVGAIWSRGDLPGQEKFCAFGYVLARMPRTKMSDEVLADSVVIATTMRYGVGTVAANFATKLTFRNS